MVEQILHYQLIQKLGAGGMGEVYLAQDTRLGRRVALKLLSSVLAGQTEHRKRFAREARAASALNHPNVCIIHEVGESDDGRPFIAMELIEGQTLEERIAKGSFTNAEIVEVAVQVADALDAAHSQNLIHRDIKPANIALTLRGQVKVLDFGLAKWIGEHEAEAGGKTSSLTTVPGTLLGSPSYMSPEQALGRPLDSRTDIFSVGVVLYQLVTGRLPFSGTTVAEIINKIVQGRFEAMARFNYEVPPELERIARKCLSTEPGRRFQSARELLVDLQSLQRELQTAEKAGLAESRSPRSPDLSLDALARDGTISLDPRESSAGAPGVFDTTFLPGGPPAGNDVLISYANLDDVPVVFGRQGWISQFHRNLELRIAQLSGKQVQVWKQPDPAEKSEAADVVLKRVPEAKAFVSVLSPPFVRSNVCRQLVETFWRSAEGAGLLEVNQRSRILKVVKTPVETSEIPTDIRTLLSRLVPYEFFERDPQSGRIREFDEAFGEAARQHFHERVYDVAYEVSQVLKHFGPGGLPSVSNGEKGKTIYLAATTSDLEAQRDQLRRELAELGHVVLPNQPLPFVASEIAAVVRSCLERCDLSIHLVGGYYGFVPEATELSIVALQNQVAARYCAEAKLDRLIWLPRGLTPHDERQAGFLRELERDPEVHRGAEVIADSLESFKVLLRARWSRKPEEKRGSRSGSEDPPRVYLICDQRDEASVEVLQDFFYEQGVEVSLPAFDVTESEFQKVHVGYLRDCDAALIYYGSGGMHWVDFNVRDLQKAAGYRNAQPIALKAVYIAPPLDRRKERFRSVSAEVLRQPGPQFYPAVLERFVSKLKALKGRKA